MTTTTQTSHGPRAAARSPRRSGHHRCQRHRRRHSFSDLQRLLLRCLTRRGFCWRGLPAAHSHSWERWCTQNSGSTPPQGRWRVCLLARSIRATGWVPDRVDLVRGRVSAERWQQVPCSWITTLDRFFPGIANSTPLLAIPIPLTPIVFSFSTPHAGRERSHHRRRVHSHPRRRAWTAGEQLPHHAEAHGLRRVHRIRADGEHRAKLPKPGSVCRTGNSHGVGLCAHSGDVHLLGLERGPRTWLRRSAIPGATCRARSSSERRLSPSSTC